MTEELTHAVVGLREDDALAMVDRLLEEGADPAGILDDCKRAMDTIGARFACGEAFIPELIMAGEIMRAVSERLRPHLAGAPAGPRRGTVVIGTVKGDIHDIGKDIVVMMLDMAGFDVVDLGVDVAPARFVGAVREHRPQVVGMSALLTVALDSMKDTVAAIEGAGLRSGLKMMVGGAPVTEQICSYAGADGWAKDAVAGVELAKQWVSDESRVR